MWMAGWSFFEVSLQPPINSPDVDILSCIAVYTTFYPRFRSGAPVPAETTIASGLQSWSSLLEGELALGVLVIESLEFCQMFAGIVLGGLVECRQPHFRSRLHVG